jgi:uncharacterized membrane protein
MFWSRRAILSPEQEQALNTAIGEAERGNRGEVVVHLERRCKGPPLERAAALFVELGLDATRDGTGVLLYAAVQDRVTAVHAGPGIHGAAAPDFWKKVADQVAAGFGKGDPAGGLVEALGALGELLRAHAPGEDTAGNEIANRVSTS